MCNCCWLAVCIVVVVLCVTVVGWPCALLTLSFVQMLMVGRVYCCSCLVCNCCWLAVCIVVVVLCNCCWLAVCIVAVVLCVIVVGWPYELL